MSLNRNYNIKLTNKRLFKEHKFPTDIRQFLMSDNENNVLLKNPIVT